MTHPISDAMAGMTAAERRTYKAQAMAVLTDMIGQSVDRGAFRITITDLDYFADLTLAGFAMEAGTTQTLSAADTDTTNGSWSTNQYAEIGSTTSGNVSVSQAKVQATAASTQTYNVTMGISGDYIGSYIVLNAAVSATTYSATFTAYANISKADR